MAAAAASFSPSVHTLKCTNTKHFPSSDSFLKFLSTTRATSLPSFSHRTYAIEPPLAVPRRAARVVSAAVAQEEAAAAAATAPVEEEQEEVAAETPQLEAVNTKLYFGNLPYNVDSAQLAGIIQDYGNPELVEVFLFTSYHSISFSILISCRLLIGLQTLVL